MERKKKEQKQVFKAGASYVWDPEDVFQLTGLEIDRINKALSAASASQEFQRHAVIYEGLIAFNQFFKSAVEEGAIRENTPDDDVKAEEKSPQPPSTGVIEQSEVKEEEAVS